MMSFYHFHDDGGSLERPRMEEAGCMQQSECGTDWRQWDMAKSQSLLAQCNNTRLQSEASKMSWSLHELNKVELGCVFIHLCM